MEKKSLTLDDLLIDEANPRYKTVQENEIASLVQMMNIQKNKLINLMKSILSIGLSPIENLAVYKSKIFKNKYVVAEGNRRISALKLLQIPENAQYGPYSSKKLTEIKNLSLQYKEKPIIKIDCTIFEDYDHAAPWIQLRHRGEQGGVGLVPWGAEENVRFDERVGGKRITTIIKNYFIDKRIITQSEADEIAITNLWRFVDDKKIQNFLQYHIENNSLIVDESNKIFLLIIGLFMKLLSKGEPKVGKIYHQDDRFLYLYNDLLIGIQEKCSEEDREMINTYFYESLEQINQMLNTNISLPSSIMDSLDNSEKASEEKSDASADKQTEKEINQESTTTSTTDSEDEEQDESKDQKQTSNSSKSDDEKQETNKNSDDESDSTRSSRPVAESFLDLFKNLLPLVKSSKIENDLITIIANDIDEASIAFDNQAYKACLIMIGASIEGIMLGTLLRDEVLDYVQDNSSEFNCLNDYGLLNPNKEELRNKFLRLITFESLRHFSQIILPDLRKTKLDEIQELRNIIHPSNALKTGNIERMQQSKAIELIASSNQFVEKIINWNPPK